MRILILFFVLASSCISIPQQCSNEGYSRGTMAFESCVSRKSASMNRAFNSIGSSGGGGYSSSNWCEVSAFGDVSSMCYSSKAACERVSSNGCVLK